MLRVLLGLAAVAAAAAVVLLGRGEAAPPGPLPEGTDGLVVLDLSASISTDTYARIGATLDGLAESGGRYGLIVFSDTAYLALPPGTPAAALRTFARRFDVPEQTGGAITVPTNPVDELVQRRHEDLERAPARARHDRGKTARPACGAPRQRPRRRRRRSRAPDEHRARVRPPRDPCSRRRPERSARGSALHRAAAAPLAPISRRRRCRARRRATATSCWCRCSWRHSPPLSCSRCASCS